MATTCLYVLSCNALQWELSEVASSQYNWLAYDAWISLEELWAHLQPERVKDFFKKHYIIYLEPGLYINVFVICFSVMLPVEGY